MGAMDRELVVESGQPLCLSQSRCTLGGCLGEGPFALLASLFPSVKWERQPLLSSHIL